MRGFGVSSGGAMKRSASAPASRAASWDPRPGVPGIQGDHAGEFLQRQAVYVDAVYHWATVALKMSSMILSMISAQSVCSTASSELVESYSA